MAEDATLLKKDIITIVKINARMQYDNPSEVQKIHDAILQKNMFSTPIGQRYVKKLEQILSGEDNYKCIFCGGEVTEKSVICDGCLSKIMPVSVKQESKEVRFEEEVKSTEEEKVEEEGKIEESVVEEPNSIQKIIRKAVEKSKETKDKAKEFWNDPKTRETKEKVLYKIEGFFYYIKEFWYSLSGMSRIIAIAIFVLIVSVIMGICSNKPGASGSQSAINITNADAAVELLETIFPEEEYTLKYQQLLYPAEAMFDGEVGKYCGESWSDKPTVDAYVISVQSIDKPRYSCICYVSVDGRIIGYGSLIYKEDTSVYFRLK